MEFNVEATMDDIVRLAGGERVDTFLPTDGPRPKNADYLFSAENAIVELKSLTQGVFNLAYQQKLQQMAQDWIARGLIYAFGRAVINLRRLPEPCQQEWLRLLTLSLQTNVINAANSQIKQTKKTLNRPEARGLLILANEGNLDYDPQNLLLLVANILKKQKPDGSLQYSSIHAVSIFSQRLLVSSPDLPGPAFFWFNAHRPTCDPALRQLQSRLEKTWYDVNSQRIGSQIRRFHLAPEKMETLRFF